MRRRISIDKFKLFKDTIKTWLCVFSMNEWETRIVKRKLEELDYAETVGDCDSMTLLIKLNEVWFEEPTDESIESTALHEVLEGLLMELRVMIGDKYPEGMVNKAVHTVIQKICNAVKQERLILP